MEIWNFIVLKLNSRATKVLCFGFSFNPSGWGSNIRSHVRDISVLLIKWYFYKIVFLFLNLQPSKLLFVSSKSRFSCHFYRSLINKNALMYVTNHSQILLISIYEMTCLGPYGFLRNQLFFIPFQSGPGNCVKYL